MENLHQKFVQLGKQRNKLTNELLAILPKIYRSGLWRKYADTIVEYAGRFGGLPKTTVKKRLGLDLSEKPLLEAAIAEVGLHKVAIINSITTCENQAEMIGQARKLSKPALRVFVKDFKGEKRVDLSVNLDEEAEFMFRKLSQRLGGNSNKEAMKRILRRLFEGEFSKEEVECCLGERGVRVGEEVELGGSAVAGEGVRSAGCGDAADCGVGMMELTGERWEKEGEKVTKKQNTKNVQKMTVTRYISKEKQSAALAETAGRCAKCHKPFEIFHHQVPFSISRSHDSIVPLCREHHELAHCGEGEVDVLYQKYRGGR